MRILYFADIRFPLERANGIQTMETCHALAHRGHDVSLVVKPDTQSPARDPFAFYGLPRLEGTQPGRLWIERANAPAGAGLLARTGYLSFAFGRAFGRQRADVIMSRDLGVTAALLRLPASMRAPVVYESHGYAPAVAEALPSMIPSARAAGPAKLRRLAAREAFVWQKAEGYVAITRGIVDEMTRRQGARDKVAVIPDGVRAPGQRPAAAALSKVVGYAGHLYAWKGVDVLLQALALVPDARGLVVGGHEKEPDLERARTLAQTLGIADRVTFTGLVEPSRVAAHLEQTAVLVLPNPASAISTHFTSPLKLFEYMAARRAIVASDLPAIREVLADGANALLVEAGNPDALAAAIRRLLSDDSLRHRLADAALAKVSDYTWAKRAEALETLFGEVTAG